MLSEAEIRTFIDGTTNFFETMVNQPASIGSPYLVTDGKAEAYDYTGIIGVSGARSNSRKKITEGTTPVMNIQRQLAAPALRSR